MTRCFRNKRLLGLLLVFLNSCCGRVNYQTAVDPITSATAVPSPIQSAELETYIPDQFGQPIGNFIGSYVNEDRLSYMGYEAIKSSRAAKVGPSKVSTEIEYAILRRSGRVITKFDSPLDRLTKVRFGLFSFLGQKDKQLVVEQTSDKFWRYWLVSLQPDFRVIYDSGKYDLVYELRATDIDGDGYSEIVQELGSFWYFGSLDNLYSPRPPIILTYDPSERIYVPANAYFRQTALKDIHERIGKTLKVIERKDDPAYGLHVRSAVLDVVLRYLYSGKPSEAWAFYDQHYKIEDKGSLKAELLRKLKQDKLYRAMLRPRSSERS